jgi:hypothetical protein
MDDVTARNIAALKQKAHELIEKQTDSLDRLCASLKAAHAVPAKG